MERRIFLDFIVRKTSPIFYLLTRKYEAKFKWWDAFLALNLKLDILDRVGLIDVKRNSLTCEGFDKNLHEL